MYKIKLVFILCIEESSKGGRRGSVKVLILCGGKGARMKEITDDIPKPLAMIGGKPILWHIMKTYSFYGFNDFVLLLGYKGDKIKKYFVECEWKDNDFVLDNIRGEIILLNKPEDWKITFIDTGEETMTGGRLKRAEKFIDGDTFMLTYGDGLSDIKIPELLEYHREKKCIATVTGIIKSNQYGVLKVDEGLATSFSEKPKSGDIINGGFFVMDKKVFNYLEGDSCVLEKEPLMNLVRDQELAVYRHNGFWTAMDTYKDVQDVNELWNSNKALWKVW